MKNIYILLFSSLLFSTINISQEHIYVSDFGAIGDGTTNDYLAIQEAIDSAAQSGSDVYFLAKKYAINNTLNLYGGVTLKGEGKGSTSTSTPYNGTIIKNIGTTLTIKITGHNSGLRDLVIYDTHNAGAAGGINIEADASDVESIILKDILIFGFTDGFGLKLTAKNGGGISYCSFYDLRIRHAKIGIHIDEDNSSYANSNSFYHGAISGGGFDNCLLVDGGNNNVFNATVMEPYSSLKGHILVNKGEIIGNNIRVEGAQQPVNTPLIEFKPNTSNSHLYGTYSGGLTIDNGDNFVLFKSGKSLGYKNSNTNLFVNASLKGLSNNSIPYWEVENSDVIIQESIDQYKANSNVIKLTVPPGIITYLRPQSSYLPKVLSNSKYQTVNFGAFIKTDRPNIITTICKAPSGIATGLYHSGNNEWEMVGMTSKTDSISSYNPKFYINTSSTIDSTVIYITSPTLNFGIGTPSIDPTPLSSSGGIINGILSTSMYSITTNATGFLNLPNQANTFEVNGTNTISRINHLANHRLPKGTIITLLFNNAGTSVINGPYIKLIANYTSVLNSSLTLVSIGDGTWRELSRNL